MGDDLPEAWSDPGSTLDLAAASARADGAEVQAMLEALAMRLEEALPRMAVVRRRRVGGFRSKHTEVERIAVDAGEERFELESAGGAIQCLRSKVVRGITLKRDVVPIDQWVRELIDAVTRSAAVGERARAVLEGLVL